MNRTRKIILQWKGYNNFIVTQKLDLRFLEDKKKNTSEAGLLVVVHLL